MRTPGTTILAVAFLLAAVSLGAQQTTPPSTSRKAVRDSLKAVRQGIKQDVSARKAAVAAHDSTKVRALTGDIRHDKASAKALKGELKTLPKAPHKAP